MSTKIHATIEDLYRVPDNAKAEIVNGEVLLMSPTGDLPSRAIISLAFSGLKFPSSVGRLLKKKQESVLIQNLTKY